MASSIKGGEAHNDGIVEDRRQPPPWYFTFLYYGLIVWGVGFSAYYLLSGWSSSGEYSEKQAAFQQQHQPTGGSPKSK